MLKSQATIQLILFIFAVSAHAEFRISCVNPPVRSATACEDEITQKLKHHGCELRGKSAVSCAPTVSITQQGKLAPNTPWKEIKQNTFGCSVSSSNCMEFHFAHDISVGCPKGYKESVIKSDPSLVSQYASFCKKVGQSKPGQISGTADSEETYRSAPAH